MDALVCIVGGMILFGAVGHLIGREKGIKYGWLIGGLLGVIGIIIVACLPRNNPVASRPIDVPSLASRTVETIPAARQPADAGARKPSRADLVRAACSLCDLVGYVKRGSPTWNCPKCKALNRTPD